MARASPLVFFKQSLKSESYNADELINIYLLRPVAAVIVWLVYPLPMTPNHVTLASIVVGLAAAWVYSYGDAAAVGVAGFLITLKDLLDDADGQLARAKELYSRRGRFLDSIGDVLVNLAVFAAITYVVYQNQPSPVTIVLGMLAFLGITLRVSYHVYYQVSFLHLENRYKLNRITEEITEEDRKGDPVALGLQQVFLAIYGWQDRLMYRIDRWCKGNDFDEKRVAGWYSDRIALRLSGLLGFGTEFAVLTVCSALNELRVYLLLNVFVMNGIVVMNVLYRRFAARTRLVK